MSDGPPGPQRPEGDGEDPGSAVAQQEPAWTRLIAPLRSEDAAFRAVLWTAGAALALAAVVLVVRAVT